MSQSDREERLAALRARVQTEISHSRDNEAQRAIEQLAAKRISEGTEELTVSVSQLTEEWDLEEATRMRTLGSVLIFIGASLGILSGLLLLVGNPVDLLSSDLFEAAESSDLVGFTLEAESGETLANVTVQIIDPEANAVTMTTMTDSNGWFRFENVVSKSIDLKLTLDGYKSVRMTGVQAEEAGLGPITMTPGEGEVLIEFADLNDQWTLDEAVSLSTVIGILTIALGLLGLHASLEARRAKKYRRTQYYAALSLFSRGMIIFGPALILAGMVVLFFVKDQFADTEVE